MPSKKIGIYIRVLKQMVSQKGTCHVVQVRIGHRHRNPETQVSFINHGGKNGHKKALN